MRKIFARVAVVAVVVAVAACQKVEKVEVAPKTLLFTTQGQTGSITAVALDGDSKPMDKAEFKWASSDDKVASVDASGKVTANKSGAVSITATTGDKKGDAQVDVKIPAKITTGTAAIALTGVGATAVIDAKVEDEISRAIDGATIGVASADAAIVSVDGMTATAKGIGATKLTLSFGKVTLDVDVTVAMPAFDKVEAAGGEAKIGGAAFQVLPTAKDAAGAAVTGVPFTYASSDEKIATVDAMGMVTGIAAGKAKIKVTAGDKTAEAEVKVSK